MSDDIHPDWHTTDDEQPVPISVVTREQKDEEVNTPAKTTTVSRKPAAIVGILLVVGTATFFFQGVQNLRGQLGAAATVLITDRGFSPKNITAAPGEELTWTNEISVPQYIISDTLCGTGNECLSTSTMFQGDSASYTIPSSAPAGDYDYFSPTDPSLTGVITIAGDAIPGSDLPQEPTVPSTPDTGGGNDLDEVDLFGIGAGEEEDEEISAAQQALLDSIQKQLNSDQSAGATVSKPKPPTPPANVPGIASNPFTVGSGNFGFNTTGRPPSPPSALAGSTTPSGALGRSIQKPFRQPDTGPGVWMVLGLSFFGIWRVTRRASPVYKAI